MSRNPLLGLLVLTFAATPLLAQEAKTIELFNGKDLTGWCYRARDKERTVGDKFDGKTESTDKRFVVKDGVLTVTPYADGQSWIQDLWTVQEFPKDFELRIEFKAAVNADSGIYVRGPQLQCRDYKVAGPWKDLKGYKPQDWNEIVVVVKGGVGKATCNGEPIPGEMKLPASGPIGVEADRGTMQYRNIRVTEIK
jgi:hypothetical protein